MRCACNTVPTRTADPTILVQRFLMTFLCQCGLSVSIHEEAHRSEATQTICATDVTNSANCVGPALPNLLIERHSSQEHARYRQATPCPSRFLVPPDHRRLGAARG